MGRAWYNKSLFWRGVEAWYKPTCLHHHRWRRPCTVAPLNWTWLFTCVTAEDQEPVLYCLVSVYVSKRCTLYHQSTINHWSNRIFYILHQVVQFQLTLELIGSLDHRVIGLSDHWIITALIYPSLIIPIRMSIWPPPYWGICMYWYSALGLKGPFPNYLWSVDLSSGVIYRKHLKTVGVLVNPFIYTSAGKVHIQV